MEQERIGSAVMPGIGFGTLGNSGETATRLVTAALAEGYRHIDTAHYYGNEEAVGRGIADSPVARDEIWLTTKILHPKAPPVSDVVVAAEDSLRRLGVDEVDLLLVHWPTSSTPLEKALEAFVRLRDQGKARAIGVSNFTVEQLGRAVRLADGIAVNQVEYHPYLDQHRLLQAVREEGLVLTAHSSLARGKVLEDPVLRGIAADGGHSPAQVALRWLVQQERVTAIPGAENVEQLRENLGALEIRLSEDEMRRIGSLARGVRVVDPAHAPSWDAA